MAEEKHSPLDQFKINPLLELNVGNYDLSITNSSVFMIAAVLSVWLFMTLGIRKRSIVPNRWQNMVEMSYEFIAGMVKENVGSEGRKFFPFIFTLFMFILFSNLLGLLPYSFTSTSHVAVTFSMAIFVFLGTIVIGFAKHGFGFFKLFLPPGIPILIAPFIFVVELISFLARPISLSVRLAAAMTAGHILLKVFAGFIIMLGSAGVFGAVAGVVLPLPFLIAFIGLELFIAFLQAYIFTVLTSLYLHDSIHLH